MLLEELDWELSRLVHISTVQPNTVSRRQNQLKLHSCISHFTRCYQLIISVHIIRPVQIISNEFYSHVVLIYFLNIFQSKFSDLREVFHTVPSLSEWMVLSMMVIVT